ncbi:MAG TPA: hypothetical protein VHC20_07645 [Candidatus Paceibacterota bacterium]|nr:hypothetical protein [Candidatus Paceibacterota bacterium]
MNKQQFLESLDEVWCRLAVTTHGVGVVAIRDIPKGVNPFKNCDPHGVKHLREFPSPPNLDQNEGVPAMRNEMKGNHLYPPIFFTYPSLQDSLRVILLNQKIASEWEKVSAYLEQHKYINNEEAREVTGVVQRDKMTQILKNWVTQGLLIQIVPSTGYLRGTRYRLPSTRDLAKS